MERLLLIVGGVTMLLGDKPLDVYSTFFSTPARPFKV